MDLDSQRSSNSLEKERTLLRKEHLETLVNRVLRLIGFHLAEIRFNRGIEDEAVFEDNLGIQACFSVKRLALEIRIGGHVLVYGPEASGKNIEIKLHVLTRGDVLQADDCPFLDQSSRYFGGGGVRPPIVLVGTRDKALQGYPPNRRSLPE